MEKNFWKRKTTHRHCRGTCGNPKCTICHANKVYKVKTKQQKVADEKLKNQ